MRIIQDEIIEVIADDGMMLVNKEDPAWTAHHLWLGINDSPSNWEEVPEIGGEQDGEFRESSISN